MQAECTRNEPDSDFLSVFDEPVRKFLKKQIEDSGHDSREISPVFDIVIQAEKKKIPKNILSYPPGIVLARIQEQALATIRSILSQDSKMKKLRERIKSYESIFLVGAGISFESGIPLTRILQDVLCFSGANSYEELTKNQKKCKIFKQKFGEICNKKKHCKSHLLLVTNFPEYIKEIICLNWDNLIERCGITLSPPRKINKINEDIPVNTQNNLWKFHGDVDNIKNDNVKGEGGWIFPHEEGYVFNCFTDYVKKSGISNSLFTFVIVGYSEKEKEIVNKIIEIFEKEPPRPTFRIGFDLSCLNDEKYIFGPSDYILPRIMPITLG